jgi:hypothetical protein
MSWTVEYAPGIRREALELWAVGPDPAATRAAIDGIEARLAADPHAAGRHLSEGLWKAVVPPLVAGYTIDPDRHVVTITDVLPADTP